MALGVSGVSSAYVGESAERKRGLGKLEEAMIRDLQENAHGAAARQAPLIISLLILTPLWLSSAGVFIPVSPVVLPT